MLKIDHDQDGAPPAAGPGTLHIGADRSRPRRRRRHRNHRLAAIGIGSAVAIATVLTLIAIPRSVEPDNGGSTTIELAPGPFDEAEASRFQRIAPTRSALDQSPFDTAELAHQLRLATRSADHSFEQAERSRQERLADAAAAKDGGEL